MILCRTLCELAFDASDDLGELAVVERPYEDQTGMLSLSFGPLASQRAEVAAIAGYEDALFGSSQFERLGVG